MNGVVKAVVQDAPKAEDGMAKSKYTGFPEPLSQHRNTTLPHPSADTSPNASIESSDVSISRTHTRYPSFQIPRLGTSKHIAKISGSLDGPASPGGLTLPDEGRGFFQDADGPSGKRALGLAVAMVGSEDGDVPTPTAMNETGNEGEEVQDWGGVKDDHEQFDGARKKGVLRKLHLYQKN